MLRKLAYALGICIAAVGLRHAAAQCDNRFATKLVEVDIGGLRFAIPRPYVANLVREEDGSVSFVRLSVLWPSLEPLTDDNKHLWVPHLPGRQIMDIIISNDADDAYQALQNAIRLKVLDRESALGPFGLQKYQKDNLGSRRTTRRFLADEQSFDTPAGTPLTFNCDDLFSWDDHRTMKLEPVCITDYALGENTGLYYRFYHKNLVFWRRIDAAVRNLVLSFQQKQQTPS